MQWAVLTGDIVNSSDMPSEDLDLILADLDKIGREAAGWAHSGNDRSETPSTRYNPFARRGGDSWQIAVNKPYFSLRLALYIQARLKLHDSACATRIAIACGKGQVSDSPGADLNSAHGPAFTHSGRLLDTMPDRTLMAHASGGALNATFRLTDHICQGWTQAQARSLCAMLPPGAGPRRVAADALGISRQAVDQALAAAGFHALSDAMDAIESETGICS